MAMQLTGAPESARSEPPTWTALVLEMVALRHQIAVLKRSGTRRPCFRFQDRLFWLLLARWWPSWRDSLVIVQPATVLRWRREGWSGLWRYRSDGRWRGGPVQNSQRASPAHLPHGAGEFPVGSTTDSWRIADARVYCLAGHRIALYAAGQPAAGRIVAHFYPQSSPRLPP
jgi:hypothetical protein